MTSSKLNPTIQAEIIDELGNRVELSLQLLPEIFAGKPDRVHLKANSTVSHLDQKWTVKETVALYHLLGIFFKMHGINPAKEVE